MLYWEGGGVRVGNTETQICSNISAFKYSYLLSITQLVTFNNVHFCFASKAPQRGKKQNTYIINKLILRGNQGCLVMLQFNGIHSIKVPHQDLLFHLSIYCYFFLLFDLYLNTIPDEEFLIFHGQWSLALNPKEQWVV